jgi:predicted DNA-binding protein (UPF0251 family)/DNA-directed RNA polymerase subunit RPC12/RpoP
MARPRKFSTIQVPPRVKGFNPVGYYSNKLDSVLLNIEEYEAIRLLDYEDLSQEDASRVMEISRPTLTRIYERARTKIAIALTEARQIKIEGGRAIFNSDWYKCRSCESKFNSTINNTAISCPLCMSRTIVNIKKVNP